LSKLTETPPARFPDSLADLENGQEWLSSALGAAVASFSLRPCDEGQLGLTVIVSDIIYVPPAPEKPPSVAIKLHAQSEDSRALGATMGAYNKELYFYTVIQPQIPLRTPEALAICETQTFPLSVYV
jgi:hypothetical protein